MKELGELEKRHQDFASKSVRIIVISNDAPETAKLTQGEFPHLNVVSDRQQNLAKAVQIIHAGMGHDGGDTNMPTTFLVDGNGIVRWVFRPDSFMERLAPDRLLESIDAHLKSAS